jgi:hypothetical protein
MAAVLSPDFRPGFHIPPFGLLSGAVGSNYLDLLMGFLGPNFRITIDRLVNMIGLFCWVVLFLFL